MDTVRVRARADFDYSATGCDYRAVRVGDELEVALPHYAGLVSAGMVEPAEPGRHAELAAASLLALDASRGGRDGRMEAIANAALARARAG